MTEATWSTWRAWWQRWRGRRASRDVLRELMRIEHEEADERLRRLADELAVHQRRINGMTEDR